MLSKRVKTVLSVKDRLITCDTLITDESSRVKSSVLVLLPETFCEEVLAGVSVKARSVELIQEYAGFKITELRWREGRRERERNTLAKK